MKHIFHMSKAEQMKCLDNKGVGDKASAEIHFDPVISCYTALRVWSADL